MKYSNAIKVYLNSHLQHIPSDVKHALRIAVQALEFYENNSFWKRTFFLFRKNLYKPKASKEFSKLNYRYFEYLVPTIGDIKRKPALVAQNALKKISQICRLEI